MKSNHWNLKIVIIINWIRGRRIKKTQSKVEDVFGDVISKGSISTEQITKLFIFSGKMMYI